MHSFFFFYTFSFSLPFFLYPFFFYLYLFFNLFLFFFYPSYTLYTRKEPRGNSTLFIYINLKVGAFTPCIGRSAGTLPYKGRWLSPSTRFRIVAGNHARFRTFVLVSCNYWGIVTLGFLFTRVLKVSGFRHFQVGIFTFRDLSAFIHSWVGFSPLEVSDKFPCPCIYNIIFLSFGQYFFLLFFLFFFISLPFYPVTDILPYIFLHPLLSLFSNI